MKKKIIFCGTPEFSIASLNSIYKHQKELNYELVGVITIKDKIAGRGQKKQESAIKTHAKKLKIKIYDPPDLNNNLFLKTIEEIKPDLMVVVAFKKLDERLFNIPTIGTINLHASLLPKYRGAAPINWAIINGEKETGLTTFFINDVIDSGDIINQKKIKIKTSWNAGDLYKELMILSDEVIKNTLDIIFAGNFKTIKQKANNEIKAQFAPKLKKQDFILNFKLWKNKPLEKLFCFIKGMTPPGLKTTIILSHTNNKKEKSEIKKNIIITRVNNIKICTENVIKSPIYIDTSYKNEIRFCNGKKSFNLQRLKLENGKEMDVKDFYNGFIKNKEYLMKMSIQN